MAVHTPKRLDRAKIAQIVDEIGELDQKVKPVLAPIEGQIRKLEDLRKQLREEYTNHPADTFFTAHGERFSITLGAKQNETYIFSDRLLSEIGKARFLKIATVSKKALENECEEAIVRAVTEMRPTGYRKLIIAPKCPTKHESAA